jgi:acetyl-CoA acyltransferase
MPRVALILDAVRTPIGRNQGSLSGIHPVDLLGIVLCELLARTAIDGREVDDVICGCVGQVGEQSVNVGRNAWLAAGLPQSVPAVTIDRQCGSSQQAVHFAAQGVVAGAYDLAVACGVESMSRVPIGAQTKYSGSPFSGSLRGRYEIVPQGIAAELIAERWKLTRAELDGVAARSHELAGRATDAGRFDNEMVPVKVHAEEGERLLEADEGIREPDPARLAALEPVFKEGGVITAGNSSQISDGAAALLLATPAKAQELGLRPRALIHTMAVAADDPVLMLTAPIPATRAALARSSLSMDDIDLVEINEAFASVVLAWKRELAIEDAWYDEHVNVHGGAIALGHPLGASGARLMTTLVNALEARGGRFGLQTMCEGGGQANATVIERLSR